MKLEKYILKRHVLFLVLFVFGVTLLFLTACDDDVGSDSSYTTKTETETAPEFCMDSDLDMSLHLLQPLGADSRIEAFDRTLTDYLKVTVCEVNSIDDCTIVEEFTSQTSQTSHNHGKGLSFITLRGDHYHVNWKVAKDSVGKQFEIHFSVADLEIRYVTYTPDTCKGCRRTVPIKFQIEKNPIITSHILKQEGFPAESVTQMLMEEHDLSMEEIISTLRYASFGFTDIGFILRDTFGLTAEAAASTLISIDWSCVNSEPCGAKEIFGIFKNVYGLDELASEQAFADMGWDQSKYLWITAYEHVKEFAPLLLFDDEQEDFPMDAQRWFEEMLCEQNDPKACFENRWNEDDPFSNRNITTLRDGNSPHSTVDGGKIPTYYRMQRCGLGQLRIEYWWFYGNQPKCDCCSGDHPADWERVVVITSDDRTEVAGVLFYQHSGWYLKNCKRWLGDNHPYVYVGRNSHGSYF